MRRQSRRCLQRISRLGAAQKRIEKETAKEVVAVAVLRPRKKKSKTGG